MRMVLFLILAANLLWAEALQERIQALAAPQKQSKIQRVNYDPFGKAKGVIEEIAEQKPQSKEFYVEAILNNKAFIQGAWREAGDAVADVEIVQIGPKSVLAKKDGKMLKLMIKKSKSYITVREEKDENE